MNKSTEAKLYLTKIMERKNLSIEEAADLMKQIMSGGVSDVQLSAILTALQMKGETIEEITGFAQIMRQYANQIKPQVKGTLVDTCGTGGDVVKTFNISTLSALVTAGAGYSVAKHGNRSVSSKCGSADLLEALGVNIGLKPEMVQQCIEEVGIGFMFAPNFHPAMKYAMPARKGLGIRTVFNILGPLTNPASATGQILGVYDKNLVEPLAHVLNNLGVGRAFVIHSEPGIDEIVPNSKVYMAEITHNNVSLSEKANNDFMCPKFTLEQIASADVKGNTEIARNILNGEDQSIRRDLVAINSAYAILTAEENMTFQDALDKAKNSIESGKALEKLNNLAELSQELNK